MPRYMTAKEAAETLNISLPTLYSYVSRGLIRSETADNSKRTRRYYADDIETLIRRKEATKNPEIMAESALDWGAPVLDSALTLIVDGRLYYRGHDVATLAYDYTLEQVAGLLWAQDMSTGEALFDDIVASAPSDLPEGLPTFNRLQAGLTSASVEDYKAYDLSTDAVQATGARILALMVAATLRTGSLTMFDTTLAEHLAGAWLPDAPHLKYLLDCAMILCADHELNASSFTARIIASTGATPYAVVSGGLSALSGVKHGGSTARVDAFLNEILHASDMRTALVQRLQRGEDFPGFGHKLYSDGDPRARILLDAIRESNMDIAPYDSIVTTMSELINTAPNIDFALVVLKRALGLPAGSALILFALGRTVGWIAHAIEQYSTDTLIRPRARYVGIQPD